MKRNKGAGRILCAACALIASAAVVSCASTYAGSIAGNPFTPESFVEELQAALETGTAQDALSLYGKVPERYADDFDLLFIKASLLFSAGQYQESRELCDELQKRDPDSSSLLELRAMLARASGNNAERLSRLKEILAKDKHNAMANIELAQDAAVKRNYKLARQYYALALEGEPGNEDALFGMGQADYFMENDDRAKKEFNQILERNPKYAPAWFYLAKLADAENERFMAVKYASRAVELDPGNYDYLVDLGIYERAMGHFKEALEAWTKAISIQPDYFLAYEYRASLNDEEGNFPDALSDYQKVVELNPDYYYAYESMGVLAVHERKWATAGAAFMKCYNYNKTNISYPLMVTYCYYMLKNDVEAKKFSDSVLRKMDRNSMDYAMLRAWHDKAGEKPLPQRISRLTNSNERGKMYFYLALFYDMMGSSSLANEFYSKVIALNSPMFFEFRIAEWNFKKVDDEDVFK